jgi:hypothetical protein
MRTLIPIVLRNGYGVDFQHIPLFDTFLNQNFTLFDTFLNHNFTLFDTFF